jgi:hypothetical protein
MIEGNAGFEPNSLIGFGNQISDINNGGVYKIMWQILTIIVFWETAFWAFKDTLAEGITNTIKGGAEAVGKYSSEALFYDKQFIHTPYGDMSPSTLFAVPDMMGRSQREHRARINEKFYQSSFGDGNKHDSKIAIALASMPRDFASQMSHLSTNNINKETAVGANFDKFKQLINGINFIGGDGKEIDLDDSKMRILRTAFGTGAKEVETKLQSFGVKAEQAKTFKTTMDKETIKKDGEKDDKDTTKTKKTTHKVTVEIVKNGETKTESVDISAKGLLATDSNGSMPSGYLDNIDIGNRKAVFSAVEDFRDNKIVKEDLKKKLNAQGIKGEGVEKGIEDMKAEIQQKAK